jgi:RND superfamily putative drug exporter
VLAALDGSTRGARTQAGFAVSLEGGGQAARITIVPDSGPNSPDTRALNDRLQGEGDRLAADSGARVDVGGVAAQLTDYQRALGSTLPLLVVALSIITFLVLIPILRAIVLPALSVVLNLLTVGASFGVVAMLFQGEDPPLGGPGYADIISLIAMFVVVFGLSLDYQVFILARIREAWQDTGDLHHAVTHAIDRTGRVVTGAAAIMAGVFISFALTDLTVVKQTGIGLATAVLIDATIVRMVLLPAALRLTGRSTFWMPAWLDRILPDLDVEGTNRAAPSAG